jgi:hypothetical protein
MTKIPTHCANRAVLILALRPGANRARPQPSRDSSWTWTCLEIRARQYSGKNRASFRGKFLALARFPAYTSVSAGRSKARRSETMYSMLIAWVATPVLFYAVLAVYVILTVRKGR